MGSKAAVSLALLSILALAVAGMTLALYITQEEAEAVPEPVTVTSGGTVTETTTRIVTEAVLNRPPAGLSDDGRLLWQLEALLRDTFGSSDFYLHYDREVAWFDHEFTGNCCSEYWNFLFPDATGSDLRLTSLSRPLPANLGASGGAVPIMVLGDYIACHDGRWLYTVVGNATTPHFYVFCDDGS